VGYLTLDRAGLFPSKFLFKAYCFLEVYSCLESCSFLEAPSFFYPFLDILSYVSLLDNSLVLISISLLLIFT